MLLKNWNSLMLMGLLCTGFGACSQNSAVQKATNNAKPVVLENGDTLRKIVKTEEEWKAQLSPEEYAVLRKQGTERAFTGDLWDNHDKGTYTCAACGLPLFHSDHKFESGTGWPSFFQPIKEGYVGSNDDYSHGMERTEVHCARCGGHLGHVFPDGPAPTGLRYCINSISMDFEKQ